jgi:hypothetical protein
MAIASLAVASAAWLPLVHLAFEPEPGEYRWAGGIAPRARLIAKRHLALWSGDGKLPADIEQMRLSNPEWDFIGRTFLVMALANMALDEPEGRDRYLWTIDRIIEDTLEVERDRGMHHFLMSYSEAAPYVVQPARSIFVDGEIALMLAHRRAVEEDGVMRREMEERIRTMIDRMEASPVLSAESYPDECWTFCNTAALAAIAIADRLDGTDHSGFLTAWTRTARERLVDRDTGLLVSSFTQSVEHLDGPEGSSIWFAAHSLGFVDPALARDQYARARRELGRTFLGFGYSREWPRAWVGPQDVDSGPVILGASPGASGLAILGAAAFHDDDFFESLLTSLEAAAFPLEEGGGLRFMASNQVGDAVLLYALVEGPVREMVMQEPR